MANYFNNIHLVSLFWKWKKQILIATVLSGIMAVVFSSSLFIKPLYSSTAIVYPANLKAFSDESNSEQMLQFLESADIRDSLIKRFDLYRHYDIDPNGSKAYYYVTLCYNDAVSIRKTLYESVEIKVMDTDPVVASNMVKAILDLYNQKLRRVQHEKFSEVYANCRQMVQAKIHEIDSLNRLLKGMHRDNQLIDFDKQTTEMVRGYLRTIDGASRTSINTPEVLKLKKELETKGTDFYLLDNQFRQAIQELGKLKENEDVALKDFNREFSYLSLVSAPFPAQKKSYPIRWLITLSTMLAVLMTSMVVVVFVENRPRIKEAITVQTE